MIEVNTVRQIGEMFESYLCVCVCIGSLFLIECKILKVPFCKEVDEKRVEGKIG